MSTDLLHMPGEFEQASETFLRPQYLCSLSRVSNQMLGRFYHQELNIMENMPSFSRDGGIFRNQLNFKHYLEYLLNMPASSVPKFRETGAGIRWIETFSNWYSIPFVILCV